MSWRMILVAIAAALVITGTFAPPKASARERVRAVGEGFSPADFCGGRFPAFGFDACGLREVRYGPGSCWRRLPYRGYGPEPPRRVWTCG
jgi:hypothetical protein